MNEEILRERIEKLSDDDLLTLFRECNGWDGYFEFVDTWDIEELASCMNTYEMVRCVIYGDVTNVVDNVRFNAYGNLESVTDYDLYNECKCCIDDLIDWIIRNNDHIDLDYYIETDDLY